MDKVGTDAFCWFSGLIETPELVILTVCFHERHPQYIHLTTHMKYKVIM